MPPDTVAVCRRTDDIVQAIAIHVEHVHVRTILSEVGRMKDPVRSRGILWTLPPSLPDDHVVSSVLVHIAVTEAMGEALGARNVLLADRETRPRCAVARLGDRKSVV